MLRSTPPAVIQESYSKYTNVRCVLRFPNSLHAGLEMTDFTQRLIDVISRERNITDLFEKVRNWDFDYRKEYLKRAEFKKMYAGRRAGMALVNYVKVLTRDHFRAWRDLVHGHFTGNFVDPKKLQKISLQKRIRAMRKLKAATTCLDDDDFVQSFFSIRCICF